MTIVRAKDGSLEVLRLSTTMPKATSKNAVSLGSRSVNGPRIRMEENARLQETDEENDIIDMEDNVQEDEMSGASGGLAPGLAEAEQSQAERREIRSQYRDIMDDLQKNKLDLICPENEKLTHKLEETQVLFKNKVKMTREAALDSQAMVMIAALGKQKAQALHTEFVVFQPAEFTLKLRRFICGDIIQNDCDAELPKITRLQWEDFGKAVQPFFRRSPPLKFLYGAIERTPVERVARVRNKIVDKDNAKEKTVPKQLKSADDITSQEATTREVERILAILQDHYNSEENGQQAICFFEFVTNPKSYGQTVENLFYTAFLVKDGHAEVSLDEDKLPVIKPVEMRMKESDRNSVKRHQVVLTMTKYEWREIIETFNIEDSLIPDRPRTVDENQRPEEMQPTTSRGRGMREK